MDTIVEGKEERHMKIELREEKFVMGLYFVSSVCSLLAVIDTVPFTSLLLKVRYLYIACIVFFCIKDCIIIWNKRLFVALGLLILHTVLYCAVFTNPMIMPNTQMLFRELVITYSNVLFTLLYIYKHSCNMEFLSLTTLALLIMIYVAAFTNFKDFVNPIYYFNVFSRYGRYRAPFGMGDVNYCGNYALYTLILLIITTKEWIKEGNKISLFQKIVIGFSVLLTVCMLFSTASRSALISLGIFVGVHIIQKYWRLLYTKLKSIFPILIIMGVLVLVVFVGSGKFSQMWVDSNREGNFSINYPIYQEYGNYINGMGYADNSGYLQKIYGYETTAQDVYYLYIWFSTGYLGAALIFGQMIYIAYLILKYRKTVGWEWVASLFPMMLFYSIWQVNYMNARYYTGTIHMIILFLFILNINEGKDTKWIALRN